VHGFQTKIENTVGLTKTLAVNGTIEDADIIKYKIENWIHVAVKIWPPDHLPGLLFCS
jgi:hypothetical protein